jgi:hypothetical protein
VHSLFVGVTLSGKTTLARYMSRELRRRAQTVIVFDPMRTVTAGGDWGEGAHIFDQEEAFLMMMEDERVQHAHIFVDEADMVFNHGRRENFWMLTRGRHYGFAMNLISQRPKLLHPTVRDQCTRLYMFRLPTNDRVELGRDKGHDDFAAYDLDAGAFVVANSAAREVTRHNIFSTLKGK